MTLPIPGGTVSVGVGVGGITEGVGQPQQPQDQPSTPEGRVRAVQRAADAALAGGPRAMRTPEGDVVIGRVASHHAGRASWVEVWVTGRTDSGESHFRIVNPPILIEDPEGAVMINGRPYREDPLGAVAQVVAMAGGSRRKGRVR